ncbi:hypothetical protein LTS08_007256 [Lithohypha guttulata]|nr:hypothetical protein LTS08_007256 [Lithohypha guttulata]
MAIIDAYEVNVLTLTDITKKKYREATRTRWEALPEYEIPGPRPKQTKADCCQRYISAQSTIDPSFGHDILTEFAVDFKVRCGFTFADNDGTEFLVFRTYLDDNKIGSAFVKRERWERSGTYRVRKRSRRYWLAVQQKWIEQNWTFDSGLHGTLRIEVWRERTRAPAIGSWNNPDLPTDNNEFGDFIDLADETISLKTKGARVRHASRIDPRPMATFEFEYRSQDTLRQLGILETPKDTIDLTFESGTEQVTHSGTISQDYSPVIANCHSDLVLDINTDCSSSDLHNLFESNPLPYMCDVCPRSTKSLTSMKIHRSLDHSLPWDTKLEQQYWWRPTLQKKSFWTHKRASLAIDIPQDLETLAETDRRSQETSNYQSVIFQQDHSSINKPARLGRGLHLSSSHPSPATYYPRQQEEEKKQSSAIPLSYLTQNTLSAGLGLSYPTRVHANDVDHVTSVLDENSGLLKHELNDPGINAPDGLLGNGNYLDPNMLYPDDFLPTYMTQHGYLSNYPHRASDAPATSVDIVDLTMFD